MKNELSIRKKLYVVIGAFGVSAILIYQALRQGSVYALNKSSKVNRNKKTLYSAGKLQHSNL